MSWSLISNSVLYIFANRNYRMICMHLARFLCSYFARVERKNVLYFKTNLCFTEDKSYEHICKRKKVVL